MVCLGEVGRNAGAGMTGGTAFVLDVKGEFSKKCNLQLVRTLRIDHPADEEKVKAMIAQHLEYTGSRLAKEVLVNWSKYAPLFWKVEPHPTETKIRMEIVVNVNRDESGRPVQMDELLKQSAKDK